MEYPDSASWRRQLEEHALLPEGFSTAVTSLEFVPLEKPGAGSLSMNLAMIRLDEPTDSFAGVFTKNAFPGWPVVQGRRLLSEPWVSGLIVNNKVANVGVEGGLEDSERLAGSAAGLFGDEYPWFASSTGVIGWKLPVTEMEAALGDLKARAAKPGAGNESLLAFSEAIMTTDAWPKVRSAGCGGGRIVGTAKGAGMVEPNMATMLAFFLTDLEVPRDAARRILPEVVNRTFNRISVDGETSTSDTVLLLSSKKKPYPGDGAFAAALEDCAALLAEDVVRNGEGCGHVFRVRLRGAETESEATALSRAVVNAPLTKTAVRGNDPNIGRILQALGAACSRYDRELDRNQLTLDIGGRRVFDKGCFLIDGKMEKELNEYFAACALPLPPPGWPVHEKVVEIVISLGDGAGEAAVIGSDLSEEYVKINADYRT